MIPMALPMIVLGAALAQVPQGPHPQGVEHIALDMNVEVTSLLGQKLYRTPAEGDELRQLQANLAEADKNAAAKPDDPAVHVQRAEALAALWLYHDAVQAYTKAISLTPTDRDLFSHRANMFILLRQFDQAKMDYEQATAIGPKVADGWIGLGIAHCLRQKFEDAVKAFTEAEGCPMTDGQKKVAGNLKTLAQRRLGKPADPAAPEWTWMNPYEAGVDKLLAGDKPGALAAWHAIANNLADWPMLPHIFAEAEIAAIEGNKKMKAITF